MRALLRVAWEDECWLVCDHGLLRFELRTRVWSRFAGDHEHLDVPVRELICKIAAGSPTS